MKNLRSTLLPLASLLASCSLPALDLEGRPCPCVEGWVCNEATNTCESGSAGAPTAGGGGAGGVGPSATTTTTGAGGAGAGGAGAAGGGGATSVYAELVKAAGPVHYYRFGDAPAQALAADEVGGLAATYGATVTRGAEGALAGDPNTAIDLDGSTAAVTLASAAFDPVGLTQYTLELWVKPSEVGVDTMWIFDRTQSFSGNRDGTTLLVYAMSSELGFERWTTVDAMPNAHVVGHPTPLTVGAWVYVVATFDGLTARIYRDLSNGTPGGPPGQLQPSTGPSTLGASNTSTPTTFFAGAIDELAIYDRVLTFDEMSQHYMAALTGQP